MPGHRKRRQSKQTDAFTRGMVIGLKRAGWSIRQIAADTHLGASTVHRLRRRWLEQGNVAIYRNAGATRVTSARVDRRILRQAVAAPQATCTAILQHVQDTLDHSISTRTISRRLVANGLHSCRPLRRLPLTPPNRRQRLEWCRARSTWMTEWHRVVFSDETRFCLSSDSRRVRVWRRRGERSNPAAIVERPTVRQRGIMDWGAIAYDSRSPLLRIQGTMTAQRYLDDVLRPVTLPYLQGVPNALYQQDNARPHTARISQQALQDVQMLPWPPYSLDLSPIEHVWDIIGRRLHALPQPRSEDELWQMVEREWRAIPQDAIRTLIDSLPRRVAACIAVRDLLRRFLVEAASADSRIIEGRLLLTQTGSLRSPWFFETARGNGSSSTSAPSEDPPWMIPATGPEPATEFWTRPYYVCASGRWFCSFTVLMHQPRSRKLSGVLSVDIDVSHLDINQCDVPSSSSSMSAFLRTHKCHSVSTQCLFTAGYGWTVGAYHCRCRTGFYSATLGTPLFNGSLVEVAWRDRQTISSPSYDLLYVCKKCKPGCDTCEDDSSCLSHYNWAFRISLLTISVLCILLTLVLVLYVYRYRKLKVIKVASPIFLSITLLGCAVMYSEVEMVTVTSFKTLLILQMAAIFPVLDMYSCVATKWTRHMGFCITYSALLLKTWRVSLTYRVKSAHKLKLTDKQLLQWLFPILLVMAIYLGTWTISSPPQGVFLVDWNGLRYRQCEFNWWDHSLAIGELLFLLWGIRVCYTVRHAESFFNEAKHISWAIYNITVVNLIMVLIQ
ncbi:GPRMGL2 [Cordylochernes scorpioides]|uniref:GPRMGL2 n=1 Tax=Cordylochernes scorpioides TaxID=51811 RepID=A0ABY6KJ03_9ARAC|nr:GPRMGL2 [Cordylochernes scorpioides]